MGTILMDLSKGFDCIPRDVLTAKFHPYGSSEYAVTFVNSYLKRRKLLLSGIPQGSTFGSILFNTLINDFIFYIKHVYLANFADDNI